MPFGPGRRFSSSHGFINRIIEGWEVNTITRWQTGRVFRVLGGLGGTVNQYDPGVQLAGLSTSQVQNMLSIRKTPSPTPVPGGAVFYFPASLLDSKQQRANSAFLKSCSTPGQFCQRLFLYGPQFFRSDISIVKRTRVSERVNIEYRAEFLNAFNNADFLFGGSAATTTPTASIQSTSFGRILSAYQDISTTSDPGGRIIQMVLRVNF
jgi:hypothetical protein